jgi:hypothetical protein
MPDDLEQTMRAELQPRPRLTITHETSAEVRSATSHANITVIVHPKLGAIGGVQTVLSRVGINRAERLSPKGRLYILRGRIEQGGAMADIEFVYAMGSDETFEQARDWLVKAWGFVVADAGG